MKKLKNCIEFLSALWVRTSTVFVLFILPVRVSCMFLEVSLSVLILKSRSKTCSQIDMVNFFKLVKNDYNDHVVSLPNYTLDFMWSEDMLSKTYVFETGEHSLVEILQDRQLLGTNIERLIDILLNKLPFMMRVKVGAVSETKRSILRKDIMRVLIRKFEHQLV